LIFKDFLIRTLTKWYRIGTGPISGPL